MVICDNNNIKICLTLSKSNILRLFIHQILFKNLTFYLFEEQNFISLNVKMVSIMYEHMEYLSVNV